MTKKDDQDTQQVPVVKELSFSEQLEALMNHAVHESIPVEGEQATEHHHHYARWANALGDIHREVKQHVANKSK